MLDFYLLIPCYNNPEGLIHSLQSVEYIKEKYSVLIVDDGSEVPVTIDSLPPEITTKHSIEIIRLPENKGITEALNTGLKYILHKNNALYTARLDCGDVCSPDRFFKQVNFLSKNPEIVLLGSWCFFQNRKKGYGYIYKAKEKHKNIRREMHWKCSFIHPTVIYRNNILKETSLYPYHFPHAEDYAFFFNLVRKHKTHILPEALVEAEMNEEGISVKKRQEQILSKINVIRQYGIVKHLIVAGVFKQYVLLRLPFTVVSVIKKYFLAT